MRNSNVTRMTKRLSVILAFGLSFAGSAIGEEQAGSTGILPIPEYGEDFWSREHASGDWGGVRTDWAQQYGLQFDVDWVQWADTVVDGGKSDNHEWGGNLTYNLEWDLMRAGIVPGAVIQIRAETRYGDSALLNTGQIVPNNTAALSPTNYNKPGGYDIALTQFSWLQMFSEHVGVIFGKLDLYANGDQNEFTSGRGRTGFSNWSLAYPTAAMYVPATTAAIGVVYLPSPWLNISSLLLSGEPCTKDPCFEDLGDKGGISATTVNYQYNLGGLPGGVTGQFVYFFDTDFTNIGEQIPVPGEGLVGSEKNKSWQVAASFWQYLSVKGGSHEGPVDLNNREQDLAGWGLFARIGGADEDTIIWENSVSVGIGGRGVVPGRPNDAFGVGYFYNRLNEDRTITSDYENGDGVEAYYNLAITPAVRFSINVQYIGNSEPGVDDATMVNGRLHVVL